jgi:hypothetical protein
MEETQMSENNIPHVVDQGASVDERWERLAKIEKTPIMPHESNTPGEWVMPNGTRLAASPRTTGSQIKTAEELFGWKWEATTESEK